jgi:hypothetical protein
MGSSGGGKRPKEGKLSKSKVDDAFILLRELAESGLMDIVPVSENLELAKI